MTPPTPKARLLRVCLIAGIAAAALVGYVVTFALTGLGFPCVLYEATRLKCGGCGLTRAAVSLLRLDFAAAFSYHALWPVFAAYFLWACPTPPCTSKRARYGFCPGNGGSTPPCWRSS